MLKRAFHILVLLAIALTGPLSWAAADDMSDAVGTYVGRQIGRGGGQTVTINLMPGGRVTVAITAFPGGYPAVSTGTWRPLGPGTVQLNLAGNAGSGTIYFSRSGDQLTALEWGAEVRPGFPLRLVRQNPVTGTYIATRSVAGATQSLTLRLSPGGTALFTVQERRVGAQPQSWPGRWKMTPSGGVQVSVDQPSTFGRLTLSRGSTGILTASDWDRGLWGPSPPVFVKVQ